MGGEDANISSSSQKPLRGSMSKSEEVAQSFSEAECTKAVDVVYIEDEDWDEGDESYTTQDIEFANEYFQNK